MRSAAKLLSHLVETGTELGWRRTLLVTLPLAGLAFLAGMLLDGLSLQATPFDNLAYPLMTGTVLALGIVLWCFPALLNAVVSALVFGISAFFLSKLLYVLYFLPQGASIQAEMTESFFWIPTLYVLSFLIPNLRAARTASTVFFIGVLVASSGFILIHLEDRSKLSVIFSLIELNLANLTLLTLTSNFIGFKERYTRTEAQAETLQHLAYTDLLTGLPNRLYLETRLNSLEARKKAFSVLFIDIDGFKLVNDTLGHGAGDEVLIEISRRFGPFVRPDRRAARLSGDEFVLLLEETPAEAATELAHHLLRELARPYQTGSQVVHLSASIGVSAFPEDAPEAAMVLKHADSAMYHAKGARKNSVRRFEPALDSEIERRNLLRRELQFAQALGQLEVVYQPIYSLEDRRIQKVEALLRWQHPELGSIAPLTFIPIAEERGQIIALGAWVLQSACRQVRAWNERDGAALTVAVNVSPLQFVQPDFIGVVRAALLESGLPARSLELELTEGAVMRNLETVQGTLAALQELGVKISIDDFGTGYSSLAYLRNLPINCIKIDRSFVADLGAPRQAPQFALALVEAIVGIAQTLELQVVAEGIETSVQCEMLRDLGCNLGQGYHLSPPLALPDMTRLLERGRPQLQPLEG